MFNPVFEKHGILPTRHIIDVIFPPDMSLGPQYFLHTFLWHHPFIMQNFRTIKALHHYIFSNKVAVVCPPLRCIRVSIFLDACPIKEHLITEKLEQPELLKEIEKIEEDLYVDDVTSGGCTVDDVQRLKDISIKVFRKAGIELHKWHSNVPVLEDANPGELLDQTFAKQQLGVKESDSKILGIHWNKVNDVRRSEIYYSFRC